MISTAAARRAQSLELELAPRHAKLDASAASAAADTAPRAAKPVWSVRTYAMGERINNFLNKKPWHPSSFRNQEAVWLAEQKAEKEEANLRIRMEEIRREKEAEDLRSAGRGGWVRAQEVRDATFETSDDKTQKQRKRARSDDDPKASDSTAKIANDAKIAAAAEAKRKAENYAKSKKRKERKRAQKAAAAAADKEAAATPSAESGPVAFANDGSFLEQARKALLAKQQEGAAAEDPPPSGS